MGHAAALTCDWTLSERVERVCKETLGLRVMRVGSLGGGSEDFSCIAQRVQQQSGQAAYVGLLCACPAANHNDHFDFDEQALANGAAMFTAQRTARARPLRSGCATEKSPLSESSPAKRPKRSTGPG